MQAISKEEYTLNGRPQLLKLFGNENPDPFSNPFLPVIESQMIIAGGVPKDNFLSAIRIAASKLGDAGFYMHAPEPHLYPTTSTYDWYIPFDDTVENIAYFKQKTLVDHISYTYYSPQGLWGLSTSDVHGVLGGPKDFCQTICKLIPGIETDVLDFVHYWQRVKAENPERIDIRWLEPMLISIYGNEMAVELLKES
jgi:hypothetical protein